jgi:DNA invertase Pin-like site-specific DNA recombinase
MIASPTGERPRAYSYIRFSTSEQALGDSLRRQTEAARLFVEKAGLQLDQELTLRDEGISAFHGRNAQTGALGAFLEAVEAGIVPRGSYLIVESLDRISRQTVRKAIRTLEEIVEAGINVVDLSDGGRVYNVETLETDQFSFVMMALRFIRANEESAIKSRRVRSAFDKKRSEAAAGNTREPFTRRLPAWLTWNEETKEYEVNRERAEIVVAIYQMADQGWSALRIAQTLNEQGLPTWGDGQRQARKAPYWRNTYVRKLLSSSAVVGTFTPHRITKTTHGQQRTPLEPIKAHWPAIVDRELFERVTARRQSTAARGRNAGAEPRSIFAGVMKCAYCGGTVTRMPKGEHVYLVCTKAHAKGGCRYQAVRYHDAEARVREIADWIVDTAPRGRSTAELEQQIESLSAAAWALAEDENDFADEWQAVKTEAARRKWHAKAAEREDVEQQLRQLRTQVDTLAQPTVIKKLEALRMALKKDQIDVSETNAALRQLVSKIVMSPERGSLTIYWHHAEDPSEPIVFGGRHMKWET